MPDSSSAKTRTRSRPRAASTCRTRSRSPLTGRIVAVSAEVEDDDHYPIQQYDKVLFSPKDAVPVDFEGDNRLFVVPVENIVAVFRKAK